MRLEAALRQADQFRVALVGRQMAGASKVLTNDMGVLEEVAVDIRGVVD